MSPSMSPSLFSELANQYVDAVQSYVQCSAEPPMQQRARAFSCRILRQGLSVLDLASMHQIALVVLMSRAETPQEQARVARAASTFFFQTLAPFEVEAQAAPMLA